MVWFETCKMVLFLLECLFFIVGLMFPWQLCGRCVCDVLLCTLVWEACTHTLVHTMYTYI